MPQLEDGRRYATRQVVAKMDPIGHFEVGGRKYKLWGHLTFYTGPDSAAIAAKFDRIAPADEQGDLVPLGVKPGEILVKPGLIYKVIPMSGMIMSEHLRQARRFTPKTINTFERDSAPAVDAGIIDLRGKV